MNLSEFSISRVEIPPAVFLASGFAVVGVFNPVTTSTEPICDLMPPPFLSETTTVGSIDFA